METREQMMADADRREERLDAIRASKCICSDLWIENTTNRGDWKGHDSYGIHHQFSPRCPLARDSSMAAELANTRDALAKARDDVALLADALRETRAAMTEMCDILAPPCGEAGAAEAYRIGHALLHPKAVE